MSDRIYVKPREGLLIRDEYNLTPIPAVGAWVKRTRHVDRRLNDGDLVEAESPPEVAPNDDHEHESEG